MDVPGNIQFVEVASYVGAWIETLEINALVRSGYVASYVGAWIETHPHGFRSGGVHGRILCGCVD